MQSSLPPNTRCLLLAALLAAMARLSPAAGGLSVGDTLPPLRGEYLTGRKAVLPQDCSGHAALLLIGFTYQSRFEVEKWAGRFREEFGANPQVTFYEVPMIGGLARMGKWFIDSGMRSGTPKADQEHVITVYGGTEQWKQRLGFGAENSAYLVLLDRNGKVAWLHSEAFGESSHQALAAQIHKQIAPN